MPTGSDQTPFAACKIAGWLVQPDRNCLVRHGAVARLEPKHMQVLQCLIEHQGNTVSKDELIAKVWPEVVVTEHSLNQAISKLRRIFEDDAKHPKIIETISKRGYRLIVPVERDFAETAAPYGLSENPAILPVKASWARFSRPLLYVIMPVLFILFAAAGAMIWIKAPGRDKAAVKLTPLTSLPGIERYPAYSPEGHRLAYVHYNPAARMANVLKLLDLSDHTTTELSETPGTIRFPCFSPDGKTLAFVTALGCEGAIHTVPATGGAATKLVQGFTDQIKGLDWSPAGKQLVYADRATPDEPFALFLYSLDTRRRTQLTAPDKKLLGEKLPAFSPDGKLIAFARAEANQSADVYLLNIASGEQRRLTYENTSIAGLDWLSDGTHIVYGSSEDMERKLVQISTTGMGTQEIYSSFEHAGVNLTASTLADRIASEYVVYQTGLSQKHFGPHSSRAPAVEAFAPTTRSNWFPQYSPDGQSLAFLSDRAGYTELWLADSDGKNLRQPAAMKLVSPNAPPRWSPDGRWILFDKKTDRLNQVFVVNASGGAPRLLATDATAPVFSQDGQWIYFSSRRTGQWQIWKMPLAGGEAIQITAGGGYVGFEGKDGGEFYFSKYDQPGIWRRSSQNEETQVVTLLMSMDKFNWQLAADGIYFVNRMQKNETPALCFFDFRTGALQQLDDFSRKLDNRFFGISLHPDRNTILYSPVERVDIDLVEIATLKHRRAP